VAERAADLAEAIREIREKQGHNAIMRGAAGQLAQRRAPAEDPLPPWWPGRLPTSQRVLEIAGPPSCGKLSLALLWLAAMRSRGLIAVVDTARTIFPPAFHAAGIDMERLVVVRPPSAREAVEAVSLLVGAAGFDAVLWPLERATRPNGITAASLSHLAARTSTRLVSLLHRSRSSDWGLPAADVRLAVTKHAWRMVDGELAGVELTVACERARGIQAPDWSFTLGTSEDMKITASGAVKAARSQVETGAEIAHATAS
jgi:hypothetical protein